MKIHECEQGTEAWYAVRRGIPTASGFKNIFTGGGKPSNTAEAYMYQLIAELGERFAGDDEQPQGRYESPAMKKGKYKESQARGWYALDTGLEVRQVGFVTTDGGEFGCSPDALVGANGGLEIKCPEAKKHVEYLHKGVLPTEHKPQVHGALYVTGLLWWDFVSYCPPWPEFRVRVQTDDYTQKLGLALTVFRLRYQEVLNSIRCH